MGYSELGAEPKRRLKRFLWVALADADAPNLPDTVGPKATAGPTNMAKVQEERKSFIFLFEE